jgi:hypothetical protein
MAGLFTINVGGIMEVRAEIKSGKKTGTTTTAYVEALRVDTRGCGVQGLTLLLLKNTGATYDLLYKVDGYPYDVDGTLSGLSYAEKAETTLAQATQVLIDVSQGYAALVVSVMNAETTNTTTYQLDWTTY